MKLFAIETGNLKLDGGAMFGVVPKVLWSKKYPADKNNLCNWAMRSLLIDTGQQRILIDTGIGTKQSNKFYSHYHLNGADTLQTSLQKVGYTVDDITDVLLTHLHFDHVGGALYHNKESMPQPTFPNAKYWVSTAQWKWATQPNRREKASFLKENIMPLHEMGLLNFVEQEGEIFSGVNLKIFNGHTNGQIIPHISYKGKTIAFMADLLPSTLHVPMPWVMAYDTRPLLTLDDKERFYNEALQTDTVLFFQHDLYNECCTLSTTEKGVVVKDTFTLNSIL